MKEEAGTVTISLKYKYVRMYELLSFKYLIFYDLQTPFKLVYKLTLNFYQITD